MDRPQIEVLAPASGIQTIKAAIYAGADAVYTGGAKFGARAYADNLIEEELLEAIDFVHLHGKRLYLTVNTLLKERELETELIPYLKPFYRQGLDAVIVQDLGVFRSMRAHFPGLAVHVSTQAVVTGADSAKLYERLGAKRIVTARELSLAEIREIRKQTNLEIESFVHGALCYCYSGQCLFSSFIGGRSGNRGRCAQPCRLPYELQGMHGEPMSKGKEKYLLSPKDMCALDILPQVIEAGVCSLKIEGRMKRTEYAAGVSELYRKYVDLYLEQGTEGYHVEPGDRQRLMDLYNRGSFHNGYYMVHGGKEMMSVERPNHNGVHAGTLRADRKGYQMKALVDISRQDVLEFRGIIDKKTEKPLELPAGMDVRKDDFYFLSEKYEMLIGKGKTVEVYRTRNALLLDELHKKYVGQARQILVSGHAIIEQGQPARLIIWKDDACIEVSGELVEMAKSRPLEEAYVRRQLEKTGNSLFAWEELQIELKGNGFVNVGALNELRRKGFESIKSAMLAPCHRAGMLDICTKVADAHGMTRNGNAACCQNYVMVENLRQLEAVLEYPQIHGIDVSIHAITLAEDREKALGRLYDIAKKCRGREQKISLVLPYILRGDVKREITPLIVEMAEWLDGIVAKNMENFAYAKSLPELKNLPIRLDYMAYVMNTAAIEQWQELGADGLTLPVELNATELMHLAKLCDMPLEMVIYGHMPMMISAQCLLRNTTGCQKHSQIIRLKDRKNHLHYVKNYCDACYNVIFNSEPLSLLDKLEEVGRIPHMVRKLQFTVEEETQVKKVLDLFVENAYLGGRGQADSFTRGHWKRGVE